MSDITIGALPATAKPQRRDIGIKARYAAERRFRFLRHRRHLDRPPLPGRHADTRSLQGLHRLLADVGQPADHLRGRRSSIRRNRPRRSGRVIKANYPKLATDALARKLGIDPADRAAMAPLKGFLSDGVRTQLRDMVVADPR